MRAQKSIYWLKGLCPKCGQGSSLYIVTCENCKKTIIECAEEGTIFPEPNDLSKTYEYYADEEGFILCPKCKKNHKFNASTLQEIESLGFTSSDYE